MDVTINIDAGGTFTDGVFTRGETIETAKVPTTEHDLTVCFLDCIEKGAEKLGTDPGDLLAETDAVRFSTTHGTNTVIEKTGPRLGVLVTAGEEDSLYGEGDDDSTVADSLVDPSMIEGIEERVDPDGTVRTEPDPEAVERAVKRLQENGARLVVVCLGNAYANDENERRVKNAVTDAYPGHYLGALPTLASHEVTARPGDRRRLNTAVLNAYIHRPMKSALYKAEDQVRERGYERPLFVGHSNGGMARVAKTVAINTHNSGPAAGVLAVGSLAELYDEDLVAADMGGTSIDISVVRDGEYTVQLNPEIDGLETNVPAIETYNLGAGGGSIASVEDGDLSVGPESAGATPGPACFGRGGREPTVTDADLVRGILNPDYFLGGSYDLAPDRAREAVAEKVADPLGVDAAEAARRIAEEAQATIAGGIRTWGEGVDAVAAFGGAGAVHAAGFADAADVDRVIVTPYSSVFSAFGESTMDVNHTYERYLGTVTPESVADGLADLYDEARRDMRSEGFDPDEVTVGADLLVESGGDHRIHDLDYAPGVDAVEGLPAVDDDETTVRLHARGDVPKPTFERSDLADPDPADARHGEREVYWTDGFEETPIYRRDRLVAGNVVTGPAVIEAVDTTVAVPPEWSFEVDAYGHGLIER